MRHASGLAPGDTAYDETRRKVGVVMDVTATSIALRPVTGGLEWDQKAERVRPATARELLAQQLRSRGLLKEPTS